MTQQDPSTASRTISDHNRKFLATLDTLSLDVALDDTRKGLRFLATMIGNSHDRLDDADYRGIGATLRAFADKLESADPYLLSGASA